MQVPKITARNVMALAMLVLATAAFVVSISQVGFTMNEEALSLKLQRLDPMAGAKRLVSKRSLVELVKGLFKIGHGIHNGRFV